MTLDEIGSLLGLLAAYDGRNVGESDVLVWARQMDGLDFGDAMDAIHQHYAETEEWAKPSHIRSLAERMRNARNRRPDVPAPGCYEPDPAERRRLLADEAGGPRALPGRYESDAARDARVRANLKALREIVEQAKAKFSMDREAQKAANAAALDAALAANPDPEVARSQFEAVREAAERERGMRGPEAGPAYGPWWADEAKREEHATALLAGLGRLHIDERHSERNGE